MGEILVTGATGNVRREEVASLLAKEATVRAAVFRVGQDALLIGAESVLFDFAAPATYSEALAGVDRLFLLRPPQVTDVKRLLFPVIDHALAQNVRQIVFLSLQGAGFTN